MAKQEEINEIRDMLDQITTANDVNNYAKTRADEELTEGVTYLPIKDTGLSKDIIVDTGETYKYYNHRLCLYIVEGDNVYPVLISNRPTSPTGYNVPSDIANFIKDNLTALVQVADMEISGGDFFDVLDNYIKSKNDPYRLVVEMSTLGPDMTGLPIWVYIDDTGSYMKSGHSGSYRFKFQQDKDLKNTRQWMPITVPDLEVLYKNPVPPCKRSVKEVEKVLTWGKYNIDLLLKLRDGELSGKRFKEQMKTMKDIAIIMDSETK